MKSILRNALRKYHELREHLDRMLLSEDGDKVAVELKKFLRKEHCWAKATKTVTKAAVTKILGFVTTVKVDGVKEFIAADKFKAGETVDRVKYYPSFGDNFTKYLLPKVERNVVAVDLRVHKLLRNSLDLGIRAEIGEDNEETSLAHLHQCLKRQGNGEKGDLLTNGWANIFYIRDTDGNLWAVSACWGDGGWRLAAGSVVHPNDWDADGQVFSR